MSKVLQIKGDLKLPGSGSVKVGVLPGSGTEPDGIELATLAQILHDGTSSILPRPFIRQPLQSSAMQEEIVRLSTRVLEGKMDETIALRRIGEAARGHILDAINARPYAPNAPSTIAAKGSDLPLVDKGVLKGAIAYRVIKGAFVREQERAEKATKSLTKRGQKLIKAAADLGRLLSGKPKRGRKKK